ncbi:MAG: hypothetical protein ACRDP4_11540, partial [Nocardioidaceae bacterium]
QPATTILPPGTTGRKEFDALGTGGTKTEPDKAKELLKKAGKEGFVVKFLYRTDNPQTVAFKDQVVKALKDAGFKASPIATTEAKFREDLSDASSPQNVRKLSWCSDWPTGGAWFPAQWDGDLVGKAGMTNRSAFKEADADKRLDHILDTMSGAKAANAWGKFDKFIMEKYFPAIPIGYSGVAMLHGSKVGGMVNNNVYGMPNFSNMYVAR